MSERIVVLRNRQVCDICHRAIPKGEKCRMIRDDFWPMTVWFEHCGCPDAAAAAENEVQTVNKEKEGKTCHGDN